MLRLRLGPQAACTKSRGRRGAAAGDDQPDDHAPAAGGAKLLGLTQQQAAELIGATYQQLHKYEKGINRIAAGRLHAIAQALGMSVGDFFAGLEGGPPAGPSAQQRALLGLARDFAAIPSGRQREALCALARNTLAGAGVPPAREDEAA